jgi:hypothetical protein
MELLHALLNYFKKKNSDEIWRHFSSETNGTYIVGKYQNLDGVEIKHLDYNIFFDSYIHYQTVGGRSYDTVFTRVRLEFKSPDDFRFRLTKQGIIDNIGKMFGSKDILVGDKRFDNKFIVKSNNEFKIQTLFSNQIIKDLILAQTNIQLQILDKEGIFDEPIGEGNSMLYYISETKVRDIAQLNSLLKLFKTLIEELVKLHSATSLLF